MRTFIKLLCLASVFFALSAQAQYRVQVALSDLPGDTAKLTLGIHPSATFNVDPAIPFGGNKQSGWGREFGREGLDPYLKTKATTVTTLRSRKRLICVSTAETIGAETGAVARHILFTKPHPEHGFRSCLGLIRLSEKYGKERTENACRRARTIGSPTYTSVKSILATGLDRQAPAPSPELRLPFDHEGLRGAEYYR